MTRQPLSLRARAVTLLAQRDHSELELRRKLGRIARDSASESVTAGDDRHVEPHGEEPDPEHLAQQAEQQVDEVVLWLRQQGYLDESRFVESRLHARASRWGHRRIEQELAQHGLSLDAEQRSALAGTELDRACEVLRRKFSRAVPLDAAQEARQMRFLMGRGFQSDVARRAIRAVQAAQDHPEADADSDLVD